MDLGKVKNVQPNRNLFKKIMALVASVIVIVVSFLIISKANQQASDTIDVLRVKSETGLQAFEPLTEDNIEKYSLIRKEHTDDMILAEDMPDVLNKLAKYYIRNESIIFKDQLVDERPLKNEWLYALDEEREVVTIPYNYLECGGDVLLPGDLIRIRVTYEVEENTTFDPYSIDTYNPNTTSLQSSEKRVETEILFDSIVVKDMLNSNSHSIYEVYKEVLRLDETKRQEVMKSEEFLRNIQPRALLLAGSEEQITNYAKFNGTNSKTFLITILSRANSEVILDQLPTLQNEVESWIEKEKN